ncbi:MAG TPA: hypothetical protein PLD19_14750, partial [Luteimonas sp.]|nr:hypothetical protein [Luteimonas sp.]
MRSASSQRIGSIADDAAISGRAVVAPAAAGDDAVEHALGRVGRAFEHQVLEQVREAGAVARLEPHADAVDHADAYHRRAAVLGHDHGEAVVERFRGDRNGPAVGVGGEGRSRDQQRGQPRRGPEQFHESPTSLCGQMPTVARREAGVGG